MSNPTPATEPASPRLNDSSTKSSAQAESSRSDSWALGSQPLPKDVLAEIASFDPFVCSGNRLSAASASHRRALIEKEVLTPLRWEEVDMVPHFTEIVE
jgi:hypothetical protein